MAATLEAEVSAAIGVQLHERRPDDRATYPVLSFATADPPELHHFQGRCLFLTLLAASESPFIQHDPGGLELL